MKGKKDRIEALKMLISSKEFCSQEDILTELIREGFEVTQATLSRDMKEILILGSIIVLRALLSFLIHFELKG